MLLGSSSRTDAAAAPDGVSLTEIDDITPELALVSPELAQTARERSRERPWEPPLRGAERVTDPDTPADGGLQRDVESEFRLRVSPAVLAPLRSGRRGARPSFLLVALVLAAAVITALTASAARPDQLERTIEQNATPARPTVQLGHTKVAEPVQPMKATQPKSETLVQPAKKAVVRPLLLGRAGYVVDPSGSFMTDRTGGSIVSFTLPLRCGTHPLAIEDIPLSSRAIRVTRRVIGRAVTVRLTARVLGRERVRGVVAANAPGCSGRVAFVARVS